MPRVNNLGTACIEHRIPYRAPNSGRRDGKGLDAYVEEQEYPHDARQGRDEPIRHRGIASRQQAGRVGLREGRVT